MKTLFILSLLLITSFPAQAEIIKFRCKVTLGSGRQVDEVMVFNTSSSTMNSKHYDILFADSNKLSYQWKADGSFDDRTPFVEIDRNTGKMTWTDSTTGKVHTEDSCENF